MQELSNLTESDEVHITIDGGKTISLTVGGVEERKVWLDYDGQQYARLTPSKVTNDEHEHTLLVLQGDDSAVGVENLEVV